MIDEDMALSALEDLSRRLPDRLAALPGAVFVRPSEDRVMVVGPTRPPAPLEAYAEGRLPEGTPWWLSLTSWGRLEMWGDVAAAGAWLSGHCRRSGRW